MQYILWNTLNPIIPLLWDLFQMLWLSSQCPRGILSPFLCFVCKYFSLWIDSEIKKLVVIERWKWTHYYVLMTQVSVPLGELHLSFYSGKQTLKALQSALSQTFSCCFWLSTSTRKWNMKTSRCSFTSSLRLPGFLCSIDSTFTAFLRSLEFKKEFGDSYISEGGSQSPA